MGACPWLTLDLRRHGYAVATLHRQSNVDDPEQLAQLWEALCSASLRLPLVFPVHPRTRARVEEAGLVAPRGLLLCDPQPYMTFLGLLAGARVVLTDSGGIQEETTVLGVPCLTLRANTERPITVAIGTNRVVGSGAAGIVPELDDVLAAAMPARPSVPLWDGLAAERSVEVLAQEVSEGRIGSKAVQTVP
jgi:UDP-N-acetylglucosamine 2-epimerase (non-hydrolysing)